MSLLDGQIAAIFNAAFSGIYLPATLHKTVLTYDDAGNPIATVTDYPCRAQIDDMSEVARSQAGYTEKERRIIVLSGSVEVPPTGDDEITVKGDRYSIMLASNDTASSHYVLRCQHG